MSCATSNDCSCGRYSCSKCKGRKESSFSSINTISSSTLIRALSGSGTASENVNIPYNVLLNTIQAALVAPSFTPSIREADISGGINVGVGTDIVICRGTGDVNMPSIALSTKPVTIISANGTATIVPDGTDTTAQTTITTGNSFVAVPYQFDSEWVNG